MTTVKARGGHKDKKRTKGKGEKPDAMRGRVKRWIHRNSSAPDLERDEAGERSKPVTTVETGSGHEDEVPAKSEEEKPVGMFERAKRWILAAGAVAGALATMVGLVFVLFPALQPPKTSAEATATLSNLEVDHNITLEDYLRRPGVPARAVADAASRLSQEQYERAGSIVYFDVELRGFEEERCFLRWSVYDAESNKPVAGLIGQSAWPSDIIVSHHQVSRAVKETWVPFPRDGEGAYLVDLELYTTVDEDEVRLDSEEVTTGAHGEVVQEEPTGPVEDGGAP